jgi:hypothetical protein
MMSGTKWKITGQLLNTIFQYHNETQPIFFQILRSQHFSDNINQQDKKDNNYDTLEHKNPSDQLSDD